MNFSAALALIFDGKKVGRLHHPHFFEMKDGAIYAGNYRGDYYQRITVFSMDYILANDWEIVE